jgi:uncharacterized membrane protein
MEPLPITPTEDLSEDISEELPEELTRSQKVRRFIRDTLDFIFIRVLLVDVVIFILVLVSFLFTGGLSPIPLSERMFWVGMFVMFLGAFVFMAAGFTGKSFGVPIIIRKPEDAKKMLDNLPKMRDESEKRYNVGARIWLIGLGCLGVSALVEVLLS